LSYEKGQRVVYDGRELCVTGDICRKCFDGVHEEEYLCLIPEGAPRSCYYVPADKLSTRVRPLMTREEIYAAIDGSRNGSGLESCSRAERRAALSEILKSGSSSLIIGMIRELLREKSSRAAEGKELIACDEKALSSACRLIAAEFSAVLGISENEVGKLIEERLDSAG
jgi:RNA polymerase-interacting CarD/CdnL/TRCF family regulator